MPQADYLGLPSRYVEEVSDQLWRIELPLPMPDLTSVNAYAIGAKDGVTLIDPGYPSPESENMLIAALYALGFSVGDVERILVTHLHWDHYAQALRWQRQLGTCVYLGHEEHHAIAAVEQAQSPYSDQVALLRTAGAHALADDVQYLELQPYERDITLGPPDVWLHDSDQINCGERTLVARATPGHTRGHFIFEIPEQGLLFTGDHVLPRITPSIGFEPRPDPYALRSYLESLQLLMSLPANKMLPAHGAIGQDVTTRVAELLSHHESRLENILSFVAAGASTAYEVAREMRWTRRLRSVDDLNTVHAMSAVLEVLAHLEVLQTQGLVEATHSQETRLYRAS